MNGADIGSYAAPALGDLDGDGDLDLVTGERLGALMYYENTGTALSPAFALRTGAANPLDGQDLGNYSAPSFGDLDHDGDFDVVAGSQDGVFYYFENTGSRFNPVFAARFGASNPFVSFGVTASSQPTIADFDRDGDVDLVTGQHYGAFLYFESFLAQQPSAIAVTGIANPLNGQDVGALSAPALADLDRDGDLDAVAGETAGTFLHYENTGSSLVPRFVARTGAANPLSGRDAGDEAKPTLADLDGDGDFDLLAGKLTGDFSYYTNTGTARTPLFAAPVINPFGLDDVGSHSAPAFADLDSDGDLDLVAGEYEGGFAYFQNTGDASSPGFVERFGLANPLNGVVVSYYATPTLADFDGDGDLDLVSGAEHGRLFWFRNTGTAIAPAFELLGNPGNLAVIDVGDRSAPASGDLNGDGTPDLVTGAVSGTFALHYLPEPARAFLFAAGAALLGWIERLRRRGS